MYSPERTQQLQFLIASISDETIRQEIKPNQPAGTKKNAKQNIPSDWSNASYLERFVSGHEYQQTTTIESALREDVEHLLREVNLGQKETDFDYFLDISSQELSRASYLETMGPLCKNFIDALAAQGKDNQRAIVEWVIYEAIRFDLTDLVTNHPDQALNQYILVASPPGTVDEGYTGSTFADTQNPSSQEKHHSFWFLLWVDEIVRDSSGAPIKAHVQVKQFRTYHNIDQTLALYNSIGAPLTPSPEKELPITNQIIAHVIGLDAASLASSTSPHQVLLSHLRTELYKPETNWLIKPSAGFSPAETENFVTSLMQLADEFYLPHALQTINQLKKDLSHQTSHRFSHRKRKQLYQAAEKNLNDLLDFFLRAAEKFVHDPSSLNSSPEKIDKLAADLESALPTFSDLKQGKKPSKKSTKTGFMRRAVSQAVSSTSSLSGLIEVGNFAFGSAQCIAFAPFTAPMSAAKMAGAGWAASLPQLRLIEAARSRGYLEHTWKVNGAPVKYLIPPQHFQTYVKKSYVKNGEVYGPCDVPLSKDNLVYRVFDHGKTKGKQTHSPTTSIQESPSFFHTLFAADPRLRK